MSAQNYNKNLVIIEDVTKQNEYKILEEKVYSEKSYISCLHLCESLHCILTGDDKGRVKQFVIHEGRGFFKLVKDYGNLGTSEVRCFSGFSFIVFVAGEKGIKAIDLKTREIIEFHLSNAIGLISTIQICGISSDKVYLVVGGYVPDYSCMKTDIFDVSNLLRSRGALV